MPIQAGPALSVTVRAGCPQPLVVRALQAATLSTETVPATGFATYSVRVAGFRAAATGTFPAWTLAMAWPQPLVTRALHRAPLSTETVPSFPFVTYSVSVASSTTTASGLLPTAALATTRQSDLIFALHFAALMTSTTWPFWAGQPLAAHWIGT